MASLSIQAQPVAHLKHKLTQDFMLECRQQQDLQFPEEKELSFYKRLVAIGVSDSKWQWDFVFSDGSKAVGQANPNLKDMKIRPADASIKIIRLLYC